MMKPICLAPWAHSHLTAGGGRALCCNSAKELPAMKFNDWWNSEYLKDVRLKMMKGEVPSECSRCFDKSNSFSYSEVFNTSFNGYLERMLNETTEDGSTTYLPVYIDYRTDLCNLKCRTCGPNASSSIQSELVQHGYMDKVNSPHKVEVEEIKTLLPNLDSIYWAGGEPLMNAAHWQIMDGLLAAKRTEVFVTYSTNCMATQYNWDRLLDYGQHFKNITLMCSVDGWGIDGEYIRSGIRSMTFFKRLLEAKNSGFKVFLDMTLTSLGLLSLDKIISFCQTYDISLTMKNIFHCKDNEYLSLHVVKLDVLQTALAKVQMSDFEYKSKIEFCLETAIARYKPVAIESCQAYINKFEKMRGDEGYFLQRMEGLLNHDDSIIPALLV